MTIVHVDHPGASYDVVIGDIRSVFDTMVALAQGQMLPLITDAHVHGLHGAALEELCGGRVILVPRGEKAKTWAVLADIVDRLAALNHPRGTPIIALGGGSVGDVAGLAASLYKRGCPVIHVPTTLLAQADSAVGGKTAIDAAGQKNIAGTFHHPALVIADPALLDTLDGRQLRAGYAEVVKTGLIDSPDFFAWCQAHGAAIIGGDRHSRRLAIEECVRAKTRHVTADPDERTGRRALLNLGHSFGHAIEASAGLGRVLHGEAVAVGLVLAFQFSASLGLCAETDARTVREHLRFVGLPTTLADLGLANSSDVLFDAMCHDKKAAGETINLVLAHGIGRAFLARDVDRGRLRSFLRSAD